MSDGPLPHFELSRHLDRLWREGRRALLAEHGIIVRHPSRHDSDHDTQEPPDDDEDPGESV